MRGATSTLAAIVAIFVTGCGGAAASMTPVAAASPTEPAVAASVAATTVAATEASLPGDPVPAELRGRWIGKSDSQAPGSEYLTLMDKTYRLQSPDGASTGDVVVNGDEIDFFDASVCGLKLPEGVGRYRWRLTAGVLHFALLATDPCGRVAVLKDADYRPAP
jgi:hypothetical protein